MASCCRHVAARSIKRVNDSYGVAIFRARELGVFELVVVPGLDAIALSVVRRLCSSEPRSSVDPDGGAIGDRLDSAHSEVARGAG